MSLIIDSAVDKARNLVKISFRGGKNGVCLRQKRKLNYFQFVFDLTLI